MDTPSAAAGLRPPAASPLQTSGDLPLTRRLPNGLVLHALEARHAPVVSLWVWYHVGGRNEVPGTTGMSHFLEHMLFKGTPLHPKGDLDRLLARYGASWNAFTNPDVTCYFETVPRDRYLTALELEADRMRDALVAPAEVEAERTVIVSEREGLENDPSFLLGEEVQSVAFARHTYGQGVIGSKDEIKLMTRDGLHAHYRRFYSPANAYVVIVGDGEAEELLLQAERAFASVGGDPAPPPPQAPEPPQQGEKRVVVRRAGGALPMVQLAFRSPRATDPLSVALSGLSVLLSGGGEAGEGASGRSSRLYKALVDAGLATETEASFSLMKDPYLFWIEASLRPNVSHAAVEGAILEELARVATEPLGDDELARVRRQMLAATAYPTDTTTGRAYQLGQLLSSGAARSIGEWYDRLASLTAEDLRAAAATTFVERSRTVGWYVPEAA